jgi:hypothetical protein
LVNGSLRGARLLDWRVSGISRWGFAGYAIRAYCPRTVRPVGRRAYDTALARLGLSQRGAARLLGIDERTMRKYVAGDLVIPELLVWALRGLAQREQDQDANSAA